MEKYLFEVNNGVCVQDGKPVWPHGITLALPRRVAFDVIRRLVLSLENSTDEPGDIHELSLYGLLKEAEAIRITRDRLHADMPMVR